MIILLYVYLNEKVCVCPSQLELGHCDIRRLMGIDSVPGNSVIVLNTLPNMPDDPDDHRGKAITARGKVNNIDGCYRFFVDVVRALRNFIPVG